MNHPLNFSPHPFRGHNPKLYGIWALNLGLLVAGIWAASVWLQLRGDNSQSHAQLSLLQTEEQQIAQDMSHALTKLGTINLKSYNKEMEQYGSIQQSLDSNWVQLLDDLASLVNEDVRIMRIQSGEASGQQDMPLTLRGESRNKDAQLQFIRAIQAHPSFRDVRFDLESYDQSRIRFELRFAYRGGAV